MGESEGIAGRTSLIPNYFTKMWFFGENQKCSLGPNNFHFRISGIHVEVCISTPVTRVLRLYQPFSQHKQGSIDLFSWQQMTLPSVSVSFQVLAKNPLICYCKLFTNIRGVLFSGQLIVRAIPTVIYTSKLFVWYFVFIV